VSILIPWGVAHTFYAVLPVEGGSAFQANPTLASGDFKISKDGGAFSNLSALPTVAPGSGVQISITLTATECEFTRAVVTAIDTATKQWKDNAWEFHTPQAEGVVCGKITSGSPTTTSFISSQLVAANNDQYNDAWVAFLTGTCAGATKKITDFVASSDTITCEALPAAPSVGDVFIIVNGA